MRDVADTASRELRPFRHPPFRRLALTQVAHAAGDGLVTVALADSLFFAVPIGEAREAVALYLAVTMAPFAILSPLVAPWLDRFRGSLRASIAVGMVGRVLLAGALSGRRAGIELYPLAFGLLVLSRVHGVSRSALVPDSTPPGRTFMWANGRLAVLSVLGGILGVAPGVLLTRTAGPDAVLLLAATVFAAGTLATLDLPRVERTAPAAGGDHRLLTPRLLAGGMAMAAIRASAGFVVFLLAFLLRAGGDGEQGLAMAAVAGGVGGFLGAAAGPFLRRLLSEPGLLATSLLLIVGAAAWAAASYSLRTALVVAAAVGLAAGASRLAFDSLVQTDAPEQARGRTFARYETIFQLTWVAGAALGSLVPLRSRGGMLTLAAISVLGLLTMAGSLLRSRAGVPEGPQDPEGPVGPPPQQPGRVGARSSRRAREVSRPR